MNRKTLSWTAAILAAGALAALLAGCGKVEDTITKFEEGLNANDAVKVADTLSRDCVDLNAYANNNWSGLQSMMDIWYAAEQPYTFSSFWVVKDGDTAIVDCTLSDALGTFPSHFLMSYETDFIFKTWKIRRWSVNASATNRIQVLVPSR